MSQHRRSRDHRRRSPSNRAARSGGPPPPTQEATSDLPESPRSARPRRSPRPQSRSASMTGAATAPAPPLLSPSGSSGRRPITAGTGPSSHSRSRRRCSNEAPASAGMDGADGLGNGASEREMRTISSGALRAGESGKTKKDRQEVRRNQRSRSSNRRDTIDVDDHPHNHNQDIPVHSLQTIESISLSEAPHNPVSAVQCSSDDYLASGAGNDSSGIHNSFHFPEVNWKALDFTHGTVLTEPNKAIEPHATGIEFARETENIFRSKSLEYLVFGAEETAAIAERHDQRHRAASSHKPRNGRANMSKQKSLSHLPVMDEKPRKQHGSSATTAMVGGQPALSATSRMTRPLQTVEEYPFEKGLQREKPVSTRQTKQASKAAGPDIHSPRLLHHHHSRSPTSSPHTSPDASAIQKMATETDEAIAYLQAEPLDAPHIVPDERRAKPRQKSQSKGPGCRSKPVDAGSPSQRRTYKLSSGVQEHQNEILMDVMHLEIDADEKKPRSRARRHSFCALPEQQKYVLDSVKSPLQKPVETSEALTASQDTVIGSKSPSNDHSSCSSNAEYSTEKRESPYEDSLGPEKKNGVKTLRRQLRRMSDGGFAGAYSGIRQAVKPILSPRKNARRVGEIVKGVGHGLGKVLHTAPRHQTQDDDTKTTLDCSPKPGDMKEVARMVGITDEQIKLLQDHGLTIADMKLTQGLTT